jgi:hypothetical protein
VLKFSHKKWIVAYKHGEMSRWWSTLPLPIAYEQGKCYSLPFTHVQNDKYANPIYPSKPSPNMDLLNPIYTYVDYI